MRVERKTIQLPETRKVHWLVRTIPALVLRRSSRMARQRTSPVCLAIGEIEPGSEPHLEADVSVPEGLDRSRVTGVGEGGTRSDHIAQRSLVAAVPSVLECYDHLERFPGEDSDLGDNTVARSARLSTSASPAIDGPASPVLEGPPMVSPPTSSNQRSPPQASPTGRQTVAGHLLAHDRKLVELRH